MKTIIFILLFATMIISGLASFHLFYNFNFNLSALLTVTSYLSIVMCVYALTVDRKKTSEAKQAIEPSVKA